MNEGLIIRENYLSSLEKALDSKKNVLVVGGRGSGKSSFARSFISRRKEWKSIYIDISSLSLNPENFSVEFCAALLSQTIGPDSHKEGKNLLPFLLSKEKEIGKEGARIILSIQNELQKIKPSHEGLIRDSFSLVSVLENHLGKKTILILDNCESLLELENFNAISDVFLLVKKECGTLPIIFLSSAKSEMKKALSDATLIDLLPLTSQEEEEILKKKYPKITKKQIDEIISLSKGSLPISRAIASQMGGSLGARKIFLTEILTKDSLLFSYCQSSVDYYSSRARGATLPRTILRIISQEELRLSEIARRIYRSAPITKSLLERLIAVDLIEKRGKTFHFCDPLLGLWMRMNSLGLTSDLPTEKEILEAERHL